MKYIRFLADSDFGNAKVICLFSITDNVAFSECLKKSNEMNITREQFKKLAKKHLIALQGYDIDETIEIYGVEKLYDEIIELEQHTEKQWKQ